MGRGIRSILVATVVAFACAFVVPAVANAAWGAININLKTGKAGVGFGEQTKADAQDEAEKKCPGKCRPALIVRNKCGAIAVNPKRYVAGFGNKKRKAIKRARKRAGDPHRLVAYVCSGIG